MALGLALALCLAAEARADVRPQYVSRVLTQPYVPLTGATQVLTPPTFDSSKAIPIGFTFRFYGESFDSIEVAENGLITFQKTCAQGCASGETCNASNVCERGWTSAEGEPMPSPHAPNRVVAGFWDDLVLDTNRAAPSAVQSRIFGAAPHRELVVEWKNVRHSTGINSAARMSFQIRLQEGRNAIRLHYGPVVPGTDNADWSGLIGMEDGLGEAAVLPLPCASGPRGCGWSDVSGLTNRVIEISVPDAPELIGSIEPKLGAGPGEAVNVQVTTRNVGIRATGAPFDVAVYLSQDASISPSEDILIGTAHVAALDAGATVTTTVAARVPRRIEAGYYTLGAVLDSNHAVTEATRENNTIASSEPFLVGADLAVRFDGDLRPMAPGVASDVAFVVTNRGSAERGVGWKLFLSQDAELDPRDIPLGEGTQAFAASAETTVVRSVRVPARTAPGYYSVIAILDADGHIPEADEANNSGYAFVVVGPDVYPGALTSPAQSGRGASLEVTLTVSNSGSAIANVPYAIYLSSDTNLDARDTLFGSGTVSVDSSAEARVTESFRVPATLTPGSYSFIVVLDEHETIPELDELNNTATMPTPIQLIGPDLSAESLNGAALAFRGQPYAMTAVIHNGGGEPVHGFFCSFHLSDNQLITTTDPLLGEVGPLDLEPGQSLTLERTVTIPMSTMPGAYWLGLIVDSSSLVAEDLEQNNQRRSPEQITVRDIAPDFTVTDVLVPVLAGSGESMVVERTLENRGNQAGEVSFAVYLVEGKPGVRRALLGRGSQVLAPNELSPGSDRVMIPGDVRPGFYRVEYAMDPDGAVPEIVEDNNGAISKDSVEVDAADLSIYTDALPVATVGLEYEATLFARGGAGTLTWSIDQGSLPEGLAIEPSSGRIRGTPAHEGEARFSVRVTAGSLSESRPFTLTVASPTVALEVATRWIPPAWAGQGYRFPLTALGGVPPYHWSIEPELPMGFTLTSSGTFEGMSAATWPSNVFTFEVTDSVGSRAEAAATFRVLDRNTALLFSPRGLADGMVGVPYEETLAAERGVPPYTFALVDGALPPGLAIAGDATRGFTVSGTPEVAGVYTFRLEVRDAAGDADQTHLVVSVEARESVTFVTKALPPAHLSTPYVDADGRPVALKAVIFRERGTVKYSITDGALPAGLTLGEGGSLDGAPTEAGVFSFIARAHDIEGNTDDFRAFGLVVGEDAAPETKDSGCGCTASPGASEDSSRSGLLFGLLGLGLVAARRGSKRRARSAALTAALAVSLTAGGAVAQVVPSATSAGSTIPYFVSEDSAVYVPRTGGTPIVFPTNDDGQATYQLPFRFKYFDQEHDTILIGTNGIMAFGGYITSPGNEPIPHNYEPNELIAPFWDDLIAGPVSVSIEGSAPNRVAVIQWSEMSRYPSGGPERFSFQLWLYEGPSARFEVHYGPTTNLSGGHSFDASVGFEDATGTSGVVFLSCTPLCTSADLGALDGHVFRAMQDAGEDVYAVGVSAAASETTNGQVRMYQNIPMDVRTKLASYHGEPIGPFQYTISLVGPGTSTRSVTLFESSPVTLGAYETRELTDAVAVPLTTPPGRYHLVMVADSGNVLSEPDEENNRSVSREEILVGERAADLRIAAVSSTVAAVHPGATLDVTLTLENAGNFDADAGWRLVLSQNRVPSLEDVVLAESVEDAHLPLATRTNLRVRVTIPETLPAGRYNLGALVDPANTVRELSEVNNADVGATALHVGVAEVAVATTELPVAYLGLDYLTRLSALGGDGTFSWELEGGSLPAGLTFSGGLVGEIRGRPTAEGTASVTFRVSSNGLTASRTLSLDVRAASGPLTIVTRQLATGFVGSAYPPAPSEVGARLETSGDRIIAVGGAGGATFALVGGAPRGLVLEPDGRLHGVPEEQGFFSVEVSATDGVSTTSRVLPLNIVEPGRLTLVVGALPIAVVGEPYAFDLFVVGQDRNAPLEFSVIEGSGHLPAGIDLSPAGLISGTPSQAGSFELAVEVKEATPRGAVDSANLVLVVEAPSNLVITPAKLPDAPLGQEFLVTFEARQGKGPYVWSYDLPGTLPRGLELETVEVEGEKKLRLHGTPTALPDQMSLGVSTGGLFTFRVRLDDAEGRHAERAMSLRLVAPPHATDAKDASCGCTSAGAGGPAADAAAGTLLLGLGLIVLMRPRPARKPR